MVYAIGTDGLHFFLIKYMHVFSTPHHSREVPLLKMAKKKKKMTFLVLMTVFGNTLIHWDNLTIGPFNNHI